MKILIVEDEPALREGLTDLLEAEGFAVEAVGDGPAGLERGADPGNNLLVLDLMLPGLDGVEVCRRLREVRPALPILILTARGSESDKVRGLEAGADDYVTKPFSIRELVARVRALGRRSGLNDEGVASTIEVDDCRIDLGRCTAARDGGREIALRLEALRQSESRRPFREYLADDGQAGKDCACESPSPSPLTQGPVDPLIWAHFQIDGLGILTLPTLGDRPEAHDPGEALQVAILNELECASSDHMHELGHGATDEPPQRRFAGQNGIVTVGPFSWHTVDIKDRPALVALREVSTPTADLTQGFVVLVESLEPMLTGAPYPVSLRPGPPSPDAEAEAGLDLDRVAWTVLADAGGAIGDAGRDAQRIRGRFLGTFAVGSSAALLAGCAMVVLVWRTERLARERARFASMAAHELRTPLASLQLYGEMLEAGAGHSARAPQYAGRVAAEARRLGRIVTNILTLSRFERGDPGLRLERGDLGEAAARTVERLRPGIDTAGIRLELDIAAPLPHVAFDPDAVDQILQICSTTPKSTHGTPPTGRSWSPSAAIRPVFACPSPTTDRA